MLLFYAGPGATWHRQYAAHDPAYDARAYRQRPNIIRIRPHPEGYQINWKDDEELSYPLPIDAVTRACEIIQGIRDELEAKERAELERIQHGNDLRRFVDGLPDNLPSA